MIAEALSNAAKHAGASRVIVAARLERNELVVEIGDDGRGGADPEGGGLRGLADRVADVGGRLRIESPPGEGTRVRAVIPAAEAGSSPALD